MGYTRGPQKEVPMAPRGKAAPNRAVDVQNPLFAEAEERVLAWLLAEGKEVRDVRDQHTYYDFIVGYAWTLDVKCDRLAVETGRVAWESLVENLSRRGPEAFSPGWGMHQGLGYVAYVLLPHDYETIEGTMVPWRVLIVDARHMREAILAEGESRNCKGFIITGSDRRATGYAVRIDWLREKGLVLAEGEV